MNADEFAKLYAQGRDLESRVRGALIMRGWAVSELDGSRNKRVMNEIHYLQPPVYWRYPPDLLAVRAPYIRHVECKATVLAGGDYALNTNALMHYGLWNELAPVWFVFGNGMVAAYDDIDLTKLKEGVISHRGSGEPYRVLSLAAPCLHPFNIAFGRIER